MQGGTGRDLVHQDAVPERPNPSLPSRSLKLSKKRFFKQNFCKKGAACQGGTGRDLVRQDAAPERPIRPCHYGVRNFAKNIVSNKTLKKRVQGGAGRDWVRLDATSEGPHPSVPPRSLKNCKHTFAKKTRRYSLH